MDWLTVAKALPIGGSYRIKCCLGCPESTSKNMIVSSSSTCYSGYCFKCGERVFKERGGLTISELLEINAANTKFKMNNVHLPEDFTYNIHTEGRMWLAEAGIHQDLSRMYKIGYSPSMRRVILPVYKPHCPDILQAIQARAVHLGVQPKYLTSQSVKHAMFESRHMETDTLVVVEDILSAIRVGEVQQACAILGTHAHSGFLNYASGYNKVILWFDGDAAGRRCTVQAKNRLDAIGVQTRVIRTQLDPKKYSNAQIKEVILSALT